MAIAQADKSSKKEIKTKRTGMSYHPYLPELSTFSLFTVLQESIDIRASVFQASPNTPKKKGSKKKKTRRSAI